MDDPERVETRSLEGTLEGSAIAEPMADEESRRVAEQAAGAAAGRAETGTAGPGWADTPLGPREAWPPSLAWAVQLVQDAAHPLAVAWGPELALVHNDAWAQGILGPGADPGPPGRPLAQAWPGFLATQAARVAEVMAGRAQRLADESLVLDAPPAPAAGPRWFSGSLTPLRDALGRVGGFLLALEETTGRVLARQAGRHEQALQREALQVERGSARLLRAVIEATTDLVWVKDRRGVITLANQRTFDLLAGGDASRVIGREPFDAIAYPEQARVIRDNDLRIMDSGLVERIEEHFGPGEAPRVYQSVKSPLRDDSGQVIGLVGVSRDVTDDRLAAERLRESNRRLEESLALLDTLFAGAPIGLTFLDPEFRYLRINDTLAVLNGLPAAEHIGRTVEEVLPELWPVVRPLLERVRDTGQALANVEVAAPIPGRPGEDGWWLAGYYPVLVRGELHGYGIVAMDVTDSKRAEQALREADRRKDDFLATLAHELRNPLAPVASAAAVLRSLHDGASAAPDRAAPPVAAAAPMLAIIERQVTHMTRLIDDLLDVSRINRGKIALAAEPLDLRAALQAALETSQPLLDAAGHAVTLALPREPVWVRGDAVRLAQVVANLLGNAAKYTPRGGRIALGLGIAAAAGAAPGSAAEAVVCVEDSGAGIPPDALESVFEMFSQLSVHGGRHDGGLGIGLWLVRQLVALHGGRVQAESEGPGSGSRFTVRLPLQPAPAPPPRPDAAPAERPRLRVLVVDDNVDAAESLALLLELDGHALAVAHDGAAALEAVRRAWPDLVLLDIGLPGMDGHAVCRAIRALTDAAPADGAARAQPRIVALTGWGQQADRDKSREAGFDDHLTKPVDATTLRAVVRPRAAIG